MSSKALREFREALQVAQTLIALEAREFHDPPRSADLRAVEGLRGGAAILMVAVFESYVRALLIEIADSIAAATPAAEFIKLPQEMQEHSIFATLDSAMSRPPGPRFNRLSGIRSAASLILQDIVNAEVFGEFEANPNAKVLVGACKRLGVRDVFEFARPTFARSWKQPVHRTFMEDTLNTIVHRRHVVAHTAAALNISRADLRTSLRFLRVLGRTLDICLRRYARGVVRRAR